LSNPNQIEAIVAFVAKHPQTIAGRRIRREVLGDAGERDDRELTTELTAGLRDIAPETLESYYYLVR